jgi:hypothetical protein
LRELVFAETAPVGRQNRVGHIPSQEESPIFGIPAPALVENITLVRHQTHVLGIQTEPPKTLWNMHLQKNWGWGAIPAPVGIDFQSVRVCALPFLCDPMRFCVIFFSPLRVL